MHAVKQEPSREQLIDEFGELDRQMQQMKPAVERYEALKAIIKGWYDHSPPGGTAIAKGRLYEIQVSARETQRRIRSMMLVYKAVGGLQKFFALVTVPLKGLEDLIGKEKAAALLVEEQCGSRRLKAVPKSSPASYKEAA